MPGYFDHAIQSEVLGRLGLPPIPYPLPPQLKAAAIADADRPPLGQLLYWLQLCSAEAGADWQGLEYAMQRLLQRLAENRDAAPSGGLAPAANEAHFAPDARVLQHEMWWFQLASAFPGGELVTLERDGYMLAALAPTEEFRLQLTVYRPLDAGSLELLTRLAAHPHPRLGVAMHVNNWQLLVDTAARPENFLASDQGQAYLAHWPMGLGGAADGDLQAELSPALVELQFRVYQRFVDRMSLNS